MTDKRTEEQAPRSNMEKNPDDWLTGDEPMTGAQRSYLKTLSEEAHEPFDANLTKAEASRRIEELQARTGRGKPSGHIKKTEKTTEPANESSMESLGRSVAEPVLGSDTEGPGSNAASGTPQRRSES